MRHDAGHILTEGKMIGDLERKALMAAVAKCIKRYFNEKMAPLQTQLKALEDQLVSVKAELSNAKRGRGASDASVQ
jgi:hypothetical protein